MEKKPAFKLTRDRRPWWQRTTVFGWLGLGVGGVLLLLILALAGRGATRWWQGRQWGHPKPTPAPVAVTEPALESPLATPAITATQPISAVWWVASMTPDGKDGFFLPEEARQELEADYLETTPYHGGPPWMLEDRVGERSVIDLYTSGLMHEGWLGRLGQLQNGSFPSPYTDVTYGQHLIQVQGCSADGLTCYLGDMVREATLGEYDVVNRRVISEKPAATGYDGTVILKVVYDLEDERWKLDEYIRWISAPVGAATPAE